MDRFFKSLCFAFCFLCLLTISCSKEKELIVVQVTEGPGLTNCYLLYELPTREAAIFDVSGRLDSLIKVINEKNLFLKYIFITHAHWDHVDGIFDLEEKFPEAKICISNEEYTAMQEYTNFAKTSDPKRFEEVMRDSALSKMISIDLRSIRPDHFIKDKEEFQLGHSIVRALLSPGHSVGSVCFSCDNLLFSGDVLFYRSAGNTNFYMASRSDLIQSVRKLYLMFPDSTIVYPGHGQITDIGSEKIKNKYISIDDGKWDTK